MRAPVFALLIGITHAALLAAQVPAGGEFRVNTYTTGDQQSPAVAAAADGSFVVVWDDYQPGGPRAQRFERDGTPLGVEFRVGTSVGNTLSPAVAVRPTDTGFLVVWPRITGGGLGTDVRAQLFDAAGGRVGAEFRVNEVQLGVQADTVVAANGMGGFVVAWGRPDGSGYGIMARQVAASGAPLGAEFRVNGNTAGPQFGNSVAADAAGNFVVVWTERPPGAPSHVIVAQRFDASGTRLGDTFQVNSATTSGHFLGRVAMRPDGAFVVAFVVADGARKDIFARRFTASGEAIGAEFQVNEYPVNQYSNAGVAMDAHGNFVVSWHSADGDGPGVAGRRFRADGVARGAEFVVNTYTTGGQHPGYSGAVGVDEVGNFVITWHSPTPFPRDVFARRFGGLHPSALELDMAGNRVWEPGETVDARPAWFNTSGAAHTVSGTLTGLAGLPGATYTITDGAAVYPVIANGAGAGCDDCYEVGVTLTGPRPALHWDATALETLAPDPLGQMKTWTLHLGASFGDVPRTSPFYRFVETLLHQGVTAGCSATSYCPASEVTREQMAPFVLVAKERTGYAPPACATPVFSDVPASSPFCRWIEELARRGVVTGCGGGNYCPTAAVTREQMAVFVLRTLDPALDPPACTTPVFNDVPASSPYCRWIEELARRGVVSGCGGGNYCPSAPVTREQMAVFLTGTFGLTLYGP